VKITLSQTPLEVDFEIKSMKFCFFKKQKSVNCSSTSIHEREEEAGAGSARCRRSRAPNWGWSKYAGPPQQRTHCNVGRSACIQLDWFGTVRGKNNCL